MNSQEQLRVIRDQLAILAEDVKKLAEERNALLDAVESVVMNYPAGDIPPWYDKVRYATALIRKHKEEREVQKTLDK